MEACNPKDESLFLRRLMGKVALVTGGADGIGESIVRKFVSEGGRVCVADIQDNLGRRLCESVGGDSNARYFHCDVSVEDDVSRAVDFAVDVFGGLDIIINNAGIADPPCRDIRKLQLETFDKVFDVNVRGVFNGMKHAARVMIPKMKGVIISTSSVASAIGGVSPHAYAGSKYAVVGLTKNVAAELGAHGIRVNCVSPYAIATRLSVSYLPADEQAEDAMASFQAFAERNANLRGVQLSTEDVANAVLFLASDEAKYVSGVNLVIDGAFSTSNHSLRFFR